jgi:hypothetical protein
MTALVNRRHCMRSLRPWKERVAAALLIAVGLAVAGTFAWQERHALRQGPVASAVTRAVVQPAPAASASAPPIGAVDTPVDEAVVDTSLRLTGWALATDGIERVEIRVDGRPYLARYGIGRPDVATVKPGYPDSALAGFEFTGDFGKLELVRHAVTVVAIDRRGRETVLASKSLIPPRAMSLWSPLLDQHPALAQQPFRFLMMTSGVAAGGAAEADSAYRAYFSRTTGVGIAVPILYLRTTKGASGDWEFDPNFDLKRKCKDRPVAEDNLHGVIQYAIDKRLPVQFILNGGIWADASCDTPEWDVNDHLEQDVDNCQWSQENRVFPDDYLKNLPGSTNSPELARALTYNVYAAKVRAYKRRNLQAAARIIADFAREHPELFVGVSLDADTYMNPFFIQNHVLEIFDYNPGMLKQFRHWLAGTGPYAGKPEPGAPNLARYRRPRSLTLAEVDKMAGKHWPSWDQVDPPRSFPGSPYQPAAPGQRLIWDDPWYQEWQVFRQHIIALHYDELSQWVNEVGIPRDRIFSAEGFIAPDEGQSPFAVKITSHGQNYDTSGVSIEGSIPRAGHLGAVLYGETAENQAPMEVPHSLFATFSRMDPGWAVVETNATNLKKPLMQPPYAPSYHAFRDMFNFDAQEISVMAWNGSNGLYSDRAGYLPYTAWRNTPAEAAMRDFMVTHANLPRGARLWSFGAPGYADDDGWRLEQGKVYARGGYLDLEFNAATATLLSPPDQVIRTNTIDSLVLGLRDQTSVAAMQMFARLDSKSSWIAVGVPIPASKFQHIDAGILVPLGWPKALRTTDAIVAEMKVVLAFNPGTTSSRLDRIALYPGSPPWDRP